MQVRKLAPKHLRQSRRSKHITCATFSASGEVLTTYNDEVQPAPSRTLFWHAIGAPDPTRSCVSDGFDCHRLEATLEAPFEASSLPQSSGLHVPAVGTQLPA